MKTKGKTKCGVLNTPLSNATHHRQLLVLVYIGHCVAYIMVVGIGLHWYYTAYIDWYWLVLTADIGPRWQS